MATINNVVMGNYAKGSGDHDLWPLIWAATRVAKKAGYKILASGDGTTKTVSDDPELDEWGAGGITNVGAAAASTGAVSGGRMTVTGLSGIVAVDKGRFLHLTGAASAGNNHYHQIEEIVSASEVRVDARRSAFTPVASDANNGSITWEVVDPTTGTRDTALDSVQAWILMQGPSTVMIPITAAPVSGPGSSFIRGENVTQATTSAEGEFLGFVFNSDTNAGYLVILPRVFGSGGDPFGWGTGNVITGATSSATVSQVGTAVEYTQRVVFHKEANSDSGHIFVQCINPVGESSDDFLTLASAAGCTATVHPGGGGTGNSFPIIGFTALGATDTATGQRWSASSSATTVFGTVGQAIAADAIWESNYSADGTFFWLCSGVTGADNQPAAGAYQVRGLFRLDDTEPGELDPFVVFGPSHATTLYGGNRTTANESNNSSSPSWLFNGSTGTQDATSTLINWRGWQGRGSSGVRDAYSDFEHAALYGIQTDMLLVEQASGSADQLASQPVFTRAREPVRLACLNATSKNRKGTVRHLQVLGGSGGAANTLYDGGKYIQLHHREGQYVGGPWDEASVPRTN